DRAVLIPENTTVILRNCTLKLSDRCRDNFFRSANCGIGVGDTPKISNIHIRGEGFCSLIGADHPRATGDGGKTLACPCPYTDEDICRLAKWIPEERRFPGKLDFDDKHGHTYGTDAEKENECPRGDWRNIGILFANAEHFSIENLHIVQSHCWAISLETCSFGSITKIDFDANMSKEIDGMRHNIENQDGIDLRNGCHHIMISDITGCTGDDVIALTAIASDDPPLPGGRLGTTHVMHSDWSKCERDIHDVIIRNVIASSQLQWMVRLLACGTKIYNVVIDGIIDSVSDGTEPAGVVILGDKDANYGSNLPDSIRNITISNLICRREKTRRSPISVRGYLADSIISNVVSNVRDLPVIGLLREDGMKNVQVSNIVSASGETVGKTIAPTRASASPGLSKK
ncbi:MAG: hypothetical protein IK088_04245, partial [Lachnospiraceae bacterium]|nr:hypothetical protein [Lachnospiraceae bacterium]